MMLTDKTALVTGGSRGIGAAIARDLAYGWSRVSRGKGRFDLARMESLELVVGPPPGKSKSFRVVDLRLDRKGKQAR